MSRLLIVALATLGIGTAAAFLSPPAYASPCTYGSYTDHASGTTYYYWFHDGEYVGTSTCVCAPPPPCQPH